MDSDEDEEEARKKPLFPLTMFISEGYMYKRLRQFNKAIASFNKSFEQDPTNEKSLLGRSECYMQQGLYSEAKLDAEAALLVNPKSTQAKLLKSEAEYFLGDFEKAFLSFRRIHDSRPKCGTARLGHQLCRRTIVNSIRPDHRAMVLDDEDIEDVTKLLSKAPRDASITADAPADSKTYADDIACLEYMLSNDIYESVHPECRELLTYLENRRNFWRYYKPYTRKRRQKPTSTHSFNIEKNQKGPEEGISSKGEMNRMQETSYRILENEKECDSLK